MHTDLCERKEGLPEHVSPSLHSLKLVKGLGEAVWDIQ